MIVETDYGMMRKFILIRINQKTLLVMSLLKTETAMVSGMMLKKLSQMLQGVLQVLYFLKMLMVPNSVIAGIINSILLRNL